MLRGLRKVAQVSNAAATSTHAARSSSSSASLRSSPASSVLSPPQSPPSLHTDELKPPPQSTVQRVKRGRPPKSQIASSPSTTSSRASPKQLQDQLLSQPQSQPQPQSSPPATATATATAPAAEEDRTVAIRVTNTWSYLTTASESIMQSLLTALTFPRKVFKPRFLRKGEKFEVPKATFISKKGRFGTGLLPIILNKLSSGKAKYTIQDERAALPQLFDTTTPTAPDGPRVHKQVTMDDPMFQSAGVQLRDYQLKAVNAALQYHRGIIKCATGGGKTWMLAAILKAIGEGVPAVIIVNKRVLAEQLSDTLKKAGIKSVGMLMGGVDNINTINICTYQTLHRSNQKMQLLANAQILMVDEVHEYATSLSREIFNDFTKAYVRLGFSATPFKHPEHKHTLISSFGPALVDISIDELVEKKVITGGIVKFYSITYPLIPSPMWQTAEDKGIVYNQYFHDTVVHLVNSIPQGRIMILVQRIAHGDALHKMLPGSFWISGKDDSDTRSSVMAQLRASTAPKVVALVSSIGFVGVDVFVHHLINAAGGREPYLTIQKIGRGLRKSGDKEVLYYHDFLFSLNMNRMLCGQSLARIRTLQQNGYDVIRQPALLRRPVDVKPVNIVKKKI